MKNSWSWIGIIILIGILSFGAYYGWQQKDAIEELRNQLASSNDSTQNQVGNNSTFKPANKSQIIYSAQITEWVKAKMPENGNYFQNIMLPAKWDFICCNDTDSYTGHIIRPAGFSTQSSAKDPYIIVYEFYTASCPGEDTFSCSLDEIQKITPVQFLPKLIKYIDQSGGIGSFSSLARLRTLKLSNFENEAVIYQGIDRSNKPIELYLFGSSKDVIGVSFVYPERFDNSFKLEFLNRITP
ncbi:hypothetical protein KJ836_03965 [Patescibacteria group bacterium]|nr:hypothetical protein [Patescibacteria group bacterium]